jgi:tripartite-type tricarboxylate transporter receptor subunit TctC
MRSISLFQRATTLLGAEDDWYLTAERFCNAIAIHAQHVGFKDPVEYAIEIVADSVHFGAPRLMVALPLIRDGKLVPLVVATPQRSPLLPDVPTATEVAPGWGRDGSQPRTARSQNAPAKHGLFIAPASP